VHLLPRVGVLRERSRNIEVSKCGEFTDDGKRKPLSIPSAIHEQFLEAAVCLQRLAPDEGQPVQHTGKVFR
jgi:hypothetical protein